MYTLNTCVTIWALKSNLSYKCQQHVGITDHVPSLHCLLALSLMQMLPTLLLLLLSLVLFGASEHQIHKCLNMVSCRSCKVTVNGEEKFTAPAKGKDAGIDETLEFILGRKEIQSHDDLAVNIEVWDYRLINHFKVSNNAQAVLLMFKLSSNVLLAYCICTAQLKHTVLTHVR